MNQRLSPEFLADPMIALVGQMADQLGVEAFLIGGYVRDLLLGRPSKDIDFMTVSSGEELAMAVALHLGVPEKLHVFKNFGTAHLVLDGKEYEFVGARKESYRTNSRKPIVEEGTLHEDLSRRDFTINALAIRINEAQYGEMVDAFEGLKHLNQGKLVTPLDPVVTFSDDPLRMLRGARFAAQLGFDLAPEALQAMHQVRERIQIISKERIADELNKLILAPYPARGFNILFNTGLLQEIFPEMAALQGVEDVNGHAHKDNFYHTLQVLDNLIPYTENLWLRWAAVLHDIAKPPTKRFEPGKGWTFHGHEDLGARMVPGLFKRLGLPQNDKMKFVQKLVRLHLRPIALVKEGISDSAIRRLLFDAGDDLEALMMLCKADITSKNPARVKRYLHNFDKVVEKLKEVEEKDRIRNFQPPVSGEEIMALFGLAPCREIGLLKNALKDAILEGEVENNPEQALPFIIKEAEKLGLAPRT